MKAISLSGKLGRGLQTIVSDEDFDFLAQWKWSLNSKGYVKRNLTIKRRGERTTYRLILMHRVVAERAGIEVANEIDHKNLNRLDNQRGNLRPATRSQNCINTGLKKSNSTGFKGVYFEKGRGKFVAQIRVSGKRLHLGRFETAELAYEAYRQAARQYHGEFCNV